jgi:hypothetical protein
MSNTQEKIGSGVSTQIIEQIKAREKVFEKDSKVSQDHLILNSNSAWVKLRSSVNQITLEDADKLKLSKDQRKEIVGDNQFAKNFILIGGTKSVSGLRSGITRTPNVIGVQSAYNNFERTLGFRPMPGITSLSVTSKNTYGTLMEATVNFNVWSVEDLNIVELLYFRPGYTTLLEWGHSVYTNNDGKIQQAGLESQTIDDKNWFKSLNSDSIETLIENKRKEYLGNYDAMYGYISNFSWEFRPDGGYDCSVKIISRGIVLESIKNAKTTDVIPKDEITKAKKEEGKIQRKSVYHYIFNKLEAEDDEIEFNGLEVLKDEGANYVSQVLEPFKVFRLAVDVKRTSGLLGFFGFEKTINLQFISLRTVLDIFNKLCTLKDNTKKNPKTKLGENIIEFNIDYGKKFFTFPEHYSLDPGVAVLPNQSTLKEFTSYANDFHSKVTTYYKKEANGGIDDILNILVSNSLVTGELDAVINDAQEEGIGYFDVIKNILSKVQNCLGEINDFDISWDGRKHVLVDRKAIAPETLPQITVSGLKTSVSSIKISSKISSAIASQLSIAAQGNSGNYQDNVSSILEWNSGAIDRHLVVKDQSTSEKDQEDDEKFEKFLEDLKDAFVHFNNGKLNQGRWTRAITNQIYDGELFNQLKPDNIAVMQKLSREYLGSQKETARGVVPVELELTFLGLGGFKVGTAFKINKNILPSKYDNFGYIITGVEHTIGTDNKWVTILKTQFFSTRKLNANAVGFQKIKDAEKADNQRTSTQPNNQLSELDIDPDAPTPNADRLRSTLTNLGYLEKGRELSNGGDITKQTADMGISVAKQVKDTVPGATLVFTGGNDLYHQQLSYNSRHKAGRGLDFVVTPSTPNYIKEVKEILQGYAAGNKPNFRFIDEYANPTKAASGKHFHISWGPGTEGQKFLSESISLANKGKIKTYTV